ncbi:MAG: hypothetical protein IPH44_38415 [Myxococcales bacterium]|nr:hypothetical protein [Myxococcales bacterium]MBK7197601.1 hypothetical protein [Myxococcales bacterium]MBP6843579.1 hypothetical protein [Kofleriaceae bacterium]
MKRIASVIIASGLLAVVGIPATRAQPSPTDPVADSPAKLRAKALNAAAVQQSRAGNKVAALGLFEDAYREFPSAALLFNIGTTQRELARLADAAATFEKFLADPQRPADRVAQATTALAELTAQLAVIEFAVVAPAADSVEIAIDGAAWRPLSSSSRVFVMPGDHVVRARSGGGAPVEVTVAGVAGAAVVAALTLEPVATSAEPPPAVAPPPASERAEVVPAPTAAPGRFGAMVAVAVDPASSGVTALVAATFAAHQRVQVNVGGMLGGNRAAFVTATATLRPGVLRPTASVGGVLAFYSWNGADHDTVGMVERTLVGARAAVGAEWWPAARVGVLAEAVAEYYPTGEPDIHPLVFTPTVGVRGRL